MKKILAFLTGLITLTSNNVSWAQQRTGDKDKSLLWRITGKNLTKPSYLFGTIHLICAQDYLWTPKMKQSLEESAKVCFEMDLDDQNLMMQAAMGLMDNTGKQLEDYFTPEQFKLLKQYLQDSLGMDVALFAQMKPIALQTMIGTTGVNCENPVSYEDSIMKIAQKADKEILGLEDPQEQIDVLESIPTDTVVKQLMEDINSNESNDSEFKEMVAVYRRQDLPALYTMLTSSKELGKDLGLFLDERNKKWIPRMTDKMKTSSVFFAVGAGHLYGQNGVITLLRKDGYTVEPLK